MEFADEVIIFNELPHPVKMTYEMHSQDGGRYVAHVRISESPHEQKPEERKSLDFMNQGDYLVLHTLKPPTTKKGES